MFNQPHIKMEIKAFKVLKAHLLDRKLREAAQWIDLEQRANSSAISGSLRCFNRPELSAEKTPFKKKKNYLK